VLLHTFVLFNHADFFVRDRAGHITFTHPNSRCLKGFSQAYIRLGMYPFQSQ
jgi:hypothetical protein